MMTLHKTVHIHIRFANVSDVYVLDLFFDKQPTSEQLVEAARCMFSELRDCRNDIAIKILDGIKELGVPDEKEVYSSTDVDIFHETDFIFHIHRGENA